MGFIFAILTGAAWGTYGIFSGLLLDVKMTENTLVAIAGVVLFLYFGIVSLIFKRQKFKKVSLKFWIIILIFGALGGGTAFNLVYMMAYGTGMPAGIVAAVSFAYVPIMMIESYFIWKFKFSIQKIIAMVVSLIGIICALNVFAGLDGAYTLAGILWTLSIPVVFATITVVDKYFLEKGVDSDVFQTILWLGGSIFTLIFLVSPVDAIRNIAEVTSAYPVSWWHLLGFCIFPQILTYVFMMASLNHTDPASFGIGHASDPIVATILGVIVFSQVLVPIQYVGIALVIVAVAYIEYREGKDEISMENTSDTI